MIGLTALILGCINPEIPAKHVDSREPSTSGSSTDSAADSATDTPPAPAALTEDAPDLDPAEGVVAYTLEAAPHEFEAPGLGWISGYAYNGLHPGPTLRARPGDTVNISFSSALDTDTTVHWHGLAVPNTLDGLTPAVAPGSAASWSFTVQQPGTYWYHPHLDTDRQVDLGLYGAFIVEDPDAPEVVADLVLVLDTWGEADADPHALDDAANARWTVNQVEAPTIPLDGPGRVRIRMINSSNTGYLAFSWPGAAQIAGDQGLAGAPRALTDNTVLVLAPGDRVELDHHILADTTLTRIPWTYAGGQVDYAASVPLFSLSVGSAPSVGDRDPYPAPASGVPADPGTTAGRYTLTGDRDETSWRINGESWPDVTPLVLPQGQHVLEIRNLSSTQHPFHVHGLRFDVLSVDGVAPEVRQLEDTIDVGIRSTVRVLLYADNPGTWLAHCHLLGHEQGGMMTVIEVEG